MPSSLSTWLDNTCTYTFTGSTNTRFGVWLSAFEPNTFFLFVCLFVCFFGGEGLLLEVERWETNISVHVDVPLSNNEKLVEPS